MILLEKNSGNMLCRFEGLAGSRENCPGNRLREEMRMEEKKQVRREVALCREALDESYLRVSDRDLFQMTAVLPEYRSASVLFCYVSVGREPDTRRLIKRALAEGKRVGVPLCTGKGRMEAREITGFEDLEAGAYGIPAPKASCPCLDPGEIQLAVLPCVTCSHMGARLGHGGGYYDRYLALLNCPAVCLCREALIREEIPLELHDRPVSAVITEKGVFRREPEKYI